MDENDPLPEWAPHNILRFHLVIMLSMAPFTFKSSSKLRSTLHFRYSIVILGFSPSSNTANNNNNNNNNNLY